jgi:hypothetical protein
LQEDPKFDRNPVYYDDDDGGSDVDHEDDDVNVYNENIAPERFGPQPIDFVSDGPDSFPVGPSSFPVIPDSFPVGPSSFPAGPDSFPASPEPHPVAPPSFHSVQGADFELSPEGQGTLFSFTLVVLCNIMRSLSFLSSGLKVRGPFNVGLTFLAR